MDIVNTMENNSSTTTENEIDYIQKVNMLTERVQQLEKEKKNMRDEFNAQRAKMKELFLQKEEELRKNADEKLSLSERIKKMQTEIDEARSQLLLADLKLESDLEVEKRKAQEEIATLQQLFHETVEESTCSRSMYDTELKKLQLLTQKLQMENDELRALTQNLSPHHSASESTSLAPSIMLSAVTKTLARKLGADGHTSQENLEESMRRAQEDAEVLRSLLVPLEEEIKALKDKLRATDEQLQQCRLCGHADNKSTGRSPDVSPVKDQVVEIKNDSPAPLTNATLVSSQMGDDEDKRSIGSASGRDKTSPVPCDMCNNYETQLVKEQQNVKELTKKLEVAEKILERQKDDLLKEINFRKEMEEKWNEKKEEHKEQVAELNKKTLCAEQDLQELRQTFEQTQSAVTEQLAKLSRERDQAREQMIKIQRENDNLVGKHSVHSQQLQSEMINLPNDVEELQLLLLNTQENLITAMVGKEAAVEQQESLRCEIQLMRDQMLMEQQTRQEFENSLVTENDSLKQQLNRIRKDAASTIELKKELEEVLRFKKHLEEYNSELKARVSALQQELDNSEQVQKDFVRLSQSLQVELEKIRASDTQVRWQHEEDVDECPGCRNPFIGQRKKVNCRHCGQIFCFNCLTHTVLSGPNRRPSKVCGVCHTLLNRNTAPYFSTEAPHLPD